jgi:23S rRNA pseudouridine1911/1915/1917 synthase
MEKEFNITIKASTPKERLDVFLAGRIGLSRSQIDKLIKSGFVELNNEKTKPAYRIKTDDRIFVKVPPAQVIEAKAENIPLDIVYEDKDIVVLNKPAGIVVHPAVGNIEGTLVNALLHHCRDLSGIGGAIRPGVVHRLDKDTSGLIVFAKNDEAHSSLSQQIKSRKVKKIYYAIVHGVVKNDKGEINAPLGRHPVQRKKMAVIRSDKLKKRVALTYYKVLKRYKNYTLLELDLKTGRTHQIRVHLSYIGHPVVGDMTYSRRKNDIGAARQLLHAKTLGFYHPKTGKYMEFCSELPGDMKEVLGNLIENKAGNDPENK